MGYFGHEDEWRHFSENHAAALESAVAVHKATLGLLQAAQAKSESTEDKTILALGLSCLKEFEEIMLLCGNGYGSGATKLLRTFFERVTTVGYLGKNPSKVPQFVEYTSVHWRKLLMEAEKKHDSVGLTEENIAKIKTDFEAVKEKYQDACDKCGKKYVQGSWTKKPVPDMAEDVDRDLRRLYFNAFLAPTFLIHATYWGIMCVAGLSENGKVHFFKPANEREMAKDTLINAHLLLIIMDIAMNNYFKLESDKMLEGLGWEFERVCRIEQETGQKQET
jgi:hypothetical protein